MATTLALVAMAAAPTVVARVARLEAQEARDVREPSRHLDAPETLTLDEAIRLARENNPGFLRQRNGQSVADWRVREAYGRLLPQVSAGGSAAYTQAGVQRIGTLDFGAQSTDWYSSSYALSFSWRLDGDALFGVSNARADADATRARIRAAAFDLESQVTIQYMAALRARDQVRVAERQLERARQNRRLVDARVASGAASGTEGKQAEVDAGRAEVAVIQARQALREQKLLLMERIGVPVEEDVRLVAAFKVFRPEWALDRLIAEALRLHPTLRASRAVERAAHAGVRQARSAYFPTVSLSTALRGNTLQALNEDFLVKSAEAGAARQRDECELFNAINAGLGRTLPGLPRDCSVFAFTDQARHDLLARNEAFPFDFTRIPMTFSLSVSLPLFNGFARQRQLEEAQAAARDAREDRREESLRIRTEVTRAFDGLETAHQVVRLEERNRAVAEEQLTLEQRRYALGAASLLELLDAQTRMGTAEQAYLNAQYDFHWNLVRLEAAVGRPLRPR